MSSENIYTSSHSDDRIPFFYIIEHTPSGKKYAGCKYGSDANPNDFMVEGGYTTSSEIVNDLIKTDGLTKFKILQLIPENFCGIDVYSYETRFLQMNRIAQRENWLNCHNNHIAPFGSAPFKHMMIKIYGVDHSMKIPSVMDEIKETNLIKYGVTFAFNTPENIAYRIAKNIENTGTANNHAKTKSTNLIKYGVEISSQSKQAKLAFKETCKEKYDVDHFMSSPEYYEEFKENLVKNFGVENIFQRPDVVAKTRQATIDRNKDPAYRKKQGLAISASLRGKPHLRCSCILCGKEISVNNVTNHYKASHQNS